MIRTCSGIRLYHLLFIAFTISVSAAVSAGEGKGIESSLSIGMGLEQLFYDEHEPDTGSDSDASMRNIIASFEGLKRWDHIFCGIEGVIPLSREAEKEEWSRSGSLYQTNDLKYGWTRIDGYVGYPLTDWFNPYLGLRWSEVKQDRNNFFVLGDPRADITKETINARHIMTGAKGAITWKSQWQFSYSMEYSFPTSTSVTNSALPGWEVADKDGYSLDVRGGVRYFYSPFLSLSMEFMGGKVHWEGSGWKAYPGGSARWPENNSLYLGCILNIVWTFPDPALLVSNLSR